MGDMCLLDCAPLFLVMKFGGAISPCFTIEYEPTIRSTGAVLDTRNLMFLKTCGLLLWNQVIWSTPITVWISPVATVPPLFSDWVRASNFVYPRVSANFTEIMFPWAHPVSKKHLAV